MKKILEPACIRNSFWQPWGEWFQTRDTKLALSSESSSKLIEFTQYQFKIIYPVSNTFAENHSDLSKIHLE